MLFSLGVMGLATAAAMVAPAAPGASAENAVAAPIGSPDEGPRIATPQANPVPPAPMPGGMISNSRPTEAVSIRTHGPPPPIVAIPRIPGPADMMVATGNDGEVRTIRSYPSNQACDRALPAVRRTISNAFCVSTTPPPPEPESFALTEISAEGELLSLRMFDSSADCERALAALPAGNGRHIQCGKFEMH